MVFDAFQHRYPQAPAPFLTDTYRTDKEQDALYEQGRSRPGPIVTNARGGESFHNYRLAADVAFRGPDLYPLAWLMNLGLLAEEYGLQWGIDDAPPQERKDKPHLQFPCTLSQARNGKLPKLPDPPLNVLVLNNLSETDILSLARDVLEGRPPVLRRPLKMTRRGEKLDVDLAPRE